MLKTLNYFWWLALIAALAAIVPARALAAEPIELDRGIAPHHPQQPQITVDAQGGIHVVYGVGNVARYRRSDDGGKTFTAAVDLPTAHSMSLGMRRGPRIAVAEKALCVTVIGGEEGKGRDGDLLAMRSVDGGKTWIGPSQVNDVADSAREGLHAMSSGPKGELYCVWLDLRHENTEVMGARSVDGGKTWSKNVLIYKSPDGSVCECCHPSVVIDSHGRVHVQWRNSLDGNRDMYRASSSDGGNTFGEAAKLGSGSWELSGCPMDGGAIASADGKLVSTWRREKSVYLLLDGQRDERRLEGGEQPSIAVTQDGPYVVWLRKRGDEAMLLSPASSSPRRLARHAFDPVVATCPDGKGPVVIAWESREGKDYKIQCLVVGNK